MRFISCVEQAFNVWMSRKPAKDERSWSGSAQDNNWTS